MRLLKLLLVMLVYAAGSACAGPPAGPPADARILADTDIAVKNGKYATAYHLIRPLAELGNAVAQNKLGVMYNYGWGVPRDYERAAAWYRKAAAQGDAVAEINLQNLLGAAPPPTTARPPIAVAMPSPADTQPPIAVATPPHASSTGSAVLMKKDGGTYVVPVLINNAITLDFTVDSGASDVSIPADVVSTLIRAGTIKDSDFIGEKTYVLADGSRVKSHTFRIRSLKVGDRVLENVIGSISSTKGSLLLGQSFLGRFKSWSIDNSRHVLLLE